MYIIVSEYRLVLEKRRKLGVLGNFFFRRSSPAYVRNASSVGGTISSYRLISTSLLPSHSVHLNAKLGPITIAVGDKIIFKKRFLGSQEVNVYSVNARRFTSILEGTYRRAWNLIIVLVLTEPKLHIF